MTLESRTRTGSALERGTLALLYVIAAAATLGFWIFRAWPELLARQPGTMSAYVAAFALFPRVQIVVAFLALAFAIARRAPRPGSALLAFVALYAISLSSELLGTTAGVPFGPYRYSAQLGAMWFGHVPLVIPLSWFTMAVPSFALAANAGTPVRRALVAALILVAWDLALDPAMTRASVYWVWGSSGAYYGMPLSNLAGWYVTALALMGALTALRAERWADALPTRWVMLFYGGNLLLPLGLCVAAGMWPAAAVTLAALMLCVPLAMQRARAVRRWSVA